MKVKKIKVWTEVDLESLNINSLLKGYILHIIYIYIYNIYRISNAELNLVHHYNFQTKTALQRDNGLRGVNMKLNPSSLVENTDLARNFKYIDQTSQNNIPRENIYLNGGNEIIISNAPKPGNRMFTFELWFLLDGNIAKYIILSMSGGRLFAEMLTYTNNSVDNIHLMNNNIENILEIRIWYHIAYVYKEYDTHSIGYLNGEAMQMTIGDRSARKDSIDDLMMST